MLRINLGHDIAITARMKIIPPHSVLKPDVVLKAYQIGVFPMARSRDDMNVIWLRPDRRAILPLGGLHMSRRWKRRSRKLDWKTTINKHFSDVMTMCAETRPDTWINKSIRLCFQELHEMGFAHSMEVWDGKDLIGGLYGLSIRSVFFGESIFSTISDAGRFALEQLHDRLCLRGYSLLDCQFYSSFLASLGAIEISDDDFQNLLKAGLDGMARFDD